MILTDTFIVEDAELLIEQRGGKTIRRLRGIFGRCDEKNNNGRIYSKPLLEREVKRIAEAMNERRLLGELDHPSHDAVKLSNVSHLITGLDFNGKDLVGECELLDTPSGKVAQALVEGGVKIGISSRGMGTLSEHADGTKHVNEDFKLVTFDLVADPSTRGAFPGISESALVEEIVKDTLDQAAKEKVFTTMLKDKLREKMEGEGTQSAKWTKETVKTLQRKGVKKNPEKATVEEPFKNWEYWYGWNTGKPRVMKTRSYPDADSVTAPAEVTENKFCLLKDIILEEDNPAHFSLVLELIREAKIKSQGKTFLSAKRTVRRPGAIKRAIAGAAEKVGRGLVGGDVTAFGKTKRVPPEGLAGRLMQVKRKVAHRTSGSPFKQRFDTATGGSGAAEKHVSKLKPIRPAGDKAPAAKSGPSPATVRYLSAQPSVPAVKKPTPDAQIFAVPSDKPPTPTHKRGFVGGDAGPKGQFSGSTLAGSPPTSKGSGRVSRARRGQTAAARKSDAGLPDLPPGTQGVAKKPAIRSTQRGRAFGAGIRGRSAVISSKIGRIKKVGSTGKEDDEK